MSSKYKAPEALEPYFVTSTVIHWIDALSRPAYKDIIVDSLNYCIQNKGLQLHAWVIMSNHLHLIASAAEDQLMGWIMRDFKKFTSKRLVEAIERNEQESRRAWMMRYFRWAGEHNSSNEIYQFWRQDYHPVHLNSKEKRGQRLHYTHDNPVRAGLVWEADHYKYSSAVDYFTDRKGLLPLIRLDDYTFM